MACKYTHPTTGEDSKLYEKLSKQYSEERADAYYKFATGPEFKSRFGDWVNFPEKYKLKKSDKTTPRLYEYGRTEPDEFGETEPIYGEPFVEDVVKEAERVGITNKPYNDGQFKNETNIYRNIVQGTISSIEKTLQKLRRKRIANLKELTAKETLKEDKENLKKIIEEENTRETKFKAVQQIGEFIKNAITQLQEATDIINRIEISMSSGNVEEVSQNAQDLQALYTYLQTYKELDDQLDALVASKYTIVPYIRNKKRKIEKAENEEAENEEAANEDFLEKLEELIEAMRVLKAKREEIEVRYEELIMDTVINKFSTGKEIIEEEMVELYRQQYLAARKKFKTEQERKERGIDKPFEEFIEEKLQEGPDFTERGKALFRNMLKSREGDISWGHRMFMNMLDVPDDVLRAFQIQLAIVEDEIRLDFHKQLYNLDKLRVKMIESYNKVFGKPESIEDQFKFMAEYNEDGNYTKFFVARYYSAWEKLLKEKKLEFINDEELTREEALAAYEEWIEENTVENFTLPTLDTSKMSEEEKEAYENDLALMADLKSKITLAKAKKRQEGKSDEFFDAQHQLYNLHSKYHSTFIIPKSKEDQKKYENPQYDQLLKYKEGTEDERVLWQYYNEYIKLHLKNEQSMPFEFQLRFKMPSMRKTAMESFENIEKGLFGRIKLFGKNSYMSEIIKPWIEESFQYVVGEIEEQGDVISTVDKEGETEKERNERLRKEQDEIEERRKQKKRRTFFRLTQSDELRERQYVPIYYRGVMETDRQSRDLHTMLVFNTFNGLNYQKMIEFLPFAEMLSSILKKRKKLAVKAGLPVYGHNFTGRNIDKRASESYNMLRDEIDKRMFGIRQIDPGYKIGNIPVAKIVQMMAQYTSLTMLSGNIDSSVANFTLASTLTITEGVAGEFYTAKQVIKAEGLYTLDFVNQLQDVLEPVDKYSKINLLNYIFDPVNSFDHREFDYAYNTKARQLIHGSSFHILNHTVEKQVQSVTMIATLLNIKVLDADGKYISKKDVTKRVDKREDAMSLYDTFNVKDGRITYTDEVSQIEIKQGSRYRKYEYKSLDQRRKGNIRITHIVQRINQQLHGNYSVRNSINFQRLLLGNLMVQHKKYLAPGQERRWGGIRKVVMDYTPFIGTYANLDKEKGETLEGEYLNKDQRPPHYRYLIFDPTKSMVVPRGLYATVYKFIGKSISDLKDLKWQVLSENWSELRETEKANMHRFVSELGFMVAANMMGLALAGMAKSEGDEEAEKVYFRLSFFSFRLYSELRQYTSLIELSRILRNPAATVTMIERIANLLGQGMTDVGAILSGESPEVYKSGLRKGQYKIEKRFFDTIPFYKHFTRSAYMKDIVSFYTETNKTR